MRCVLRHGLCGLVCGLTLIVMFGGVADSLARNTSARGSFVSLIRPNDLPDRNEWVSGPLDRILGATPDVIGREGPHAISVTEYSQSGRSGRFPFAEDSASTIPV